MIYSEADVFCPINIFVIIVTVILLTVMIYDISFYFIYYFVFKLNIVLENLNIRLEKGRDGKNRNRIKPN